MTDPKKPTSALDVLNDPNTIVLVLDSSVESQIAMRWLRANAPKCVADQRVLTDGLDLRQLQAAFTLCAVYRNPERPAFEYEPDKQGVVRARPRPDQANQNTGDPGLFSEMVITKPVKVSDFWDRPSPTAFGTINTARFLEALQPTLSPFRLDYIDKGEQRPSIMKLSTL